MLGAGISEGGKTGIAAMVTGICFFISVFFAPIFASIPPWATGCTLIIIGSLMAKAAADINWRYMGDAIPAFLTIVVMPFTYSIAYGLIAGITSYILINTGVFLVEKASGGRLVPQDKQLKEPWSWKIEGGLFPPWLVRAAKGKKDFWKPYEMVDHGSQGDQESVTEVPSSGVAKGLGPDEGSNASSSKVRRRSVQHEM